MKHLRTYFIISVSDSPGPRLPRFLSIALILLALAGTLTACKSPSNSGQISQSPMGSNAETNLLREGDLVGITFQNFTNLNTAQKIPLDGLLNLENIGAVKAAGKTPEELQAELGRLYGPQTRNDPVTVKLLAAATAVYVSGAVLHAGRVPMDRPMTAFEAIMEAGGFDPGRAKISDITIVRIAEGRQKIFHVDLKRVLQGEEPSAFYLKPFDIVHVPTKTFNF